MYFDRFGNSRLIYHQANGPMVAQLNDSITYEVLLVGGFRFWLLLSPNGRSVPPLRDRIAGLFTNQLSPLSREDFRRGCISVGVKRCDV